MEGQVTREELHTISSDLSFDTEFRRKLIQEMIWHLLGEGWSVGAFQHHMEFLTAALGTTVADAAHASLGALLYKLMERLKAGETITPPLAYGTCPRCQHTIYLPKDHDWWCGD